MNNDRASFLWDFPDSCFYHTAQRISKELIFERVKQASAVRQALVHEVSRVELVARCDAETLKLSSDDNDKFVIIRVSLKGKDVNRSVIRSLDRAIPYPIIFQLVRETGDTQMSPESCLVMGIKDIAYVDGVAKCAKLPQLYVESGWFSYGFMEKMELPLGLSVHEIYEQLYKDFLRAFGAQVVASVRQEPYPPTGTAEDSQVSARELESEATQKIRLTREVERLQKKWKREQQHSRKTKIRAEIIRLKEQLAAL